MKKITNKRTRARQEIIDFIVKKYINLNLDLDACQGCCEDLDEKFGLLRYYKKIVKYLGGINDKEFEKTVHNKHNEVYNERIKKQEQKNCKYCSPYGKIEVIAGQYKNINMFVDPDDNRLDMTCHVGWEYDKDLDEHLEITEDDVFPINYCPYCGRKLGEENEK